MPGLLTLKTDLKSLKYGHDTPGGGDSGQPYIKTDINTVDSGFNKLRLTKFDDGLVRGGIVGAVNASVVDTIRIGKFFLDAPKGPLFIAKQIGLQLSNPRLEVPKNPLNIAQGGLDNVLAAGTNGLLEPTRIYNLGINTLAQIPVNAIGGHFNRHGLLPVQNEASKYEAVVTANNNLFFATNPSQNNRLVSLAKKFKLGDRQANNTQSQNVLSNLNVALNVVNSLAGLVMGGAQLPTLNTNPDQLIINKYFGGPGSVYGIGNTIINRASNTEDGFLLDRAIRNNQMYAGKTRNTTTGAPEEVNYTSGLGKGNNAISNYEGVPTDPNLINKPNNPSLKTYTIIRNQILDQQDPENASKLYTSGSTTLYTNQFGIYKTQHNGNTVDNTKGNYNDNPQEYIAYKNSYNEVVKIKTNGGWNTIAREKRIGSGRQDEINLTPIFSKGSYWYDNSVTIDKKEHNIRDLIKFAIQAVDTDTPTNSNFMIFRAYLTQFSDSVDSQWTDIKYVGRGNPFYIYNGFTRKIQIGFKVAALSAAEMQPMYSKLNYLMSNLMPDYKDNLMRGPLVRMTVGNYLDAQLGKLDSVSYTIPNDSPWEIALDEPEGGTKQLILPHIIEVSLGFTPIGAETGVSINGTGSVSNKIEEKSSTTSYLAQNTTGADVGTIQYIK